MCNPLEREVAADEPRRFAARVEPEREGCWWGVREVGVEGLCGGGGGGGDGVWACCPCSLKGQTWEFWYAGERVGFGERGTAWLLERGTFGYLTVLFGESPCDPSGTGERCRSISSGGVISSGSVLSKDVSEPPEHL